MCIPSLNIGCETVVNVYYFFQVTKDSLVNVEKQKEFFLSLLKNASSFIQLEALATLLQTWPDTWYVCSLDPGLLNWFQAQTQTQATFWLLVYQFMYTPLQVKYQMPCMYLNFLT